MPITLSGSNGFVSTAGTVSNPSLGQGPGTSGIYFPNTAIVATTILGAEAMRVDQQGNVQIGTTNNVTASKLTISHFGSNSAGLAIGDTNTPSANTGIYLYTTGVANISVGTGGTLTFNRNGGAVESMRITSTGNLLVGTTSTTAGGGVLQIANGITFPATQVPSGDANTLDDYEEGTFVPNVIHSGSNNSTWTQKNGYYTKIGRQVTIWFVCDGGNSGTAGTQLQLSNLPFALGTISGVVTFGTFSQNGTVKNGGLMQNTSGATTLWFYTGGSGLTEQQTYASGFATYFTA